MSKESAKQRPDERDGASQNHPPADVVSLRSRIAVPEMNPPTHLGNARYYRKDSLLRRSAGVAPHDSTDRQFLKNLAFFE